MKVLLTILALLASSLHLMARTVTETLSLGDNALDAKVSIADNGDSVALELDVPSYGVDAMLQVGNAEANIVSVPVETRHGAFTISRNYLRSARLVFADQEGNSTSVALSKFFTSAELPTPTPKPAAPTPVASNTPAAMPASVAAEDEREFESYTRGKSRFLRER
ncbi:MAG: hypothetical protein E1N59_1454 [Puniceicoccaceae bacterium 5H]|nr:MAG: hypothetical protein E1N59_1454 [Puniceicoccaceae bacterium 5H]